MRLVLTFLFFVYSSFVYAADYFVEDLFLAKTPQEWASILGIVPGQNKGFGVSYKSSDITNGTYNYRSWIFNNPRPSPYYEKAVRDLQSGTTFQGFLTPVKTRADAVQFCGLMGATLASLKTPVGNLPNATSMGAWNRFIAPIAEGSPKAGYDRAWALNVAYLNVGVADVKTSGYLDNHSLSTASVTGYSSRFSGTGPIQAWGTSLFPLDQYYVDFVTSGSNYGLWLPGYYVVHPDNGTYDGTEQSTYIQVDLSQIPGNPYTEFVQYPICEWPYSVNF